MKQKTILLTATLFILAACSQSEMETEERAPKEIKATSVIEGASTRALIEGTDVALSNLTFLRKDATNTSSHDFSSATEITGSSRATSGGKITFGDGSASQDYKKTGENAYFRGFTTEGATVNTGSSVKWTINGKTDILLTDVWNAGTYDNPETTGMIFKHLLSRIEVICQAEATTTSKLDVVRAAWGKVTKIEVLNANHEITYTYSTNAVTLTGDAKAFELFAGYGDDDGKFENKDIVANGATDTKAVAMIPPIPFTNSPSYSFQLKVTTAGAAVTTGQPTSIEKTINVSLGNSSSAMTAGQIHKVTLSFKADGKEISCGASTITAWDDNGSTGEADVEKGDK